MKITSIPSCVPNWYDPDVKGYQRPASVKGARFRFRVKVGRDPARELATARERYEKEFPDAIIHVVPEFEDAPTNPIETKGSDEELLRSYFDANPPEGGTVDQAVAYLRPLVGGRFGVEPIEFLEVEAENVLCFEKAKWNLDRTGMTLITGINRDWDDEISNGCIAKGTFIDCPRNLEQYPFGIPVEELVGTRPLVYCYDPRLGRITIRKASWVGKTGDEVPVVRIRFSEPFGNLSDSKRKNFRPQKFCGKRIPFFTELTLTKDHKVMLRDGSYCKAGELKPGDRVMPLYRRSIDGEYWAIGLSDGKKRIKNTGGAPYHKSTVVLENRFILSELKGKRSKKFHAHHKDENKGNNDPKNLEWKDERLHVSDHLRKRNLEKQTGWQKHGRHPRGMKGKSHTEATRKRISQTLKRVRYRNNHVVVSVEPAGFSDVYDLKVPGVNNFVANSVVVHNSGKSSYASLPFLPLFGRTFKNQADDGWARQKTAKTAKITGKYRLSDRRTLTAVRTRRPGTARAWLDGREISMGGKTDTNRMLERLTNLTWDVLINSVYIGQREVGTVFGTEKERKELFSRLLGLDRFLDGQKKVGESLRRVRRSLESIESDFDAAEAALREANAGTEGLAEELKSLPSGNDLKAHEREIGNAEAAIRVREKLIADLNVEMETNQKQFEGFLFEGVEAEANANALREQIDKANSVSGRCAVCGSRVSEDVTERYVAELESRRKPLLAVLERSERQQEANRNVRRTMIEGARNAKAEIDKLRLQLKQLQLAVANLRAAAETRSRLEALLAGSQKRVAALEREKRIHERAAGAEREEIAFLESCSRAMSRDGIPAHLCARVTPKLNAAAAHYSEIFASGEIGVSFSASAGDVDVEITNLHGGGSAKDQSEGEMRMAGNVVVFAFRDVLVPHNLLVLDEPGAGLDPANAETFARALNRVVDRFKHIVIISHNERIVGALEPNYLIEIVKENGVSKAREL